MQPPPPAFYLEGLPQSITAVLSLEERILAEEAWQSLREGRGSKAEKSLSRMETSSPVFSVGLGYAYFLQNDLLGAESSFKQALTEYPDMILARLGLAQIYQETGRENLLFNELREILKREPRHPWASREYRLLKTRKTDEYAEEAERAIAEGNAEKATEAYLSALHYSPENTDIHLALADIYKKEKKFQDALVHLKTASSNEPKNIRILKNYAETLYLADHLSRSLDVYEQMLEIDPDNSDVKTQIEQLKAKLGIFELPSQYEAIASSETLTREEMAALLAVKLKDYLDEPPVKPSIIVDISTSWASRFIVKIASLGFMDVYANHSFQPKKVMTRAETAEVFLRLLAHLGKKGYRFIQQFPPEKIQIADVSPDNVYYQPILLILSYQIMDLPPNKTFRPGQGISGFEAIKTLDVLLGLMR